MSPSDDWTVYTVCVKRFYDDLLRARAAVKGFQENSAYETEVELGRGRRLKKAKRRAIYSDSSSEGDATATAKQGKRCTFQMPSPPPVPFDFASIPTSRGSSQFKVVSAQPKNVKKAQALDALMRVRDSKKTEREQVLEMMSNNGKSESAETSTRKNSKTTQYNSPKKNAIYSSPKVRLKSPHMKRQSPWKVRDKSPTFSPSPSKRQRSDSVVLSILSTPVTPRDQSDVCTTEEVSRTPVSEGIRTPDGPHSLRRFSPVESSCRRLFTEKDKNGPESGTRPVQDSSVGQVLSRIEFKIEKKLEEISCKVDTVLLNQARINRKFLPHEKRVERPHDLPSLPLKTVGGLKRFEEFLRERLNFSATRLQLCEILEYSHSHLSVPSKPQLSLLLADYFSVYVCSSEVASTRKLLRSVVTNSLASNYSFKGEKNKKCFEKLYAWKVIEGALLKHHPNSDLSEAQDAASKWLKNAPWRTQDDGSKGKRVDQNKSGDTSRL